MTKTDTAAGGPPEDAPDDLMEKVVRLCRHRGFIFPSAEIYGGFRSTYDYGPLGVNMLRNVKNAWWRAMVQERDDVVGLDAAILGPPAVWEASGHLATFTDPLVDCKNCHERWRADKIDGVCPNCGSHDLTEARAFNLMFKTHAGPVEDEGHVAYLRPETAQGMFTNFANVLGTTRKKPPFGIAQVGKSFRNEITPQNFVFRTREFEQMELEYFVPPAEAPKWFEYWLNERMDWYLRLGIPADQLRLRHHEQSELSHYSLGHGRRRVPLPLGLGRARGHRQPGRLRPDGPRQGLGGDARLLRPADQRALHALCDRAGGRRHPDDDGLLARRLREDEVGGEPRTVLRLHWSLAPYQVAVLPLSKKDTLEPLARSVLKALQPHFMCDYDVTQSIGRRYRRQDEVGTPWCVTVDFDSLEDNAVTVRDRDTTEQVRVPIDDLVAELRRRTGEEPLARHGPAQALCSGDSLRQPGGTCAPPAAPGRSAARSTRPRTPRPRPCSAACPPTMSERAASTTWVTGWWLAKACSQPGIALTGTKADEAKMNGKRIGNTMVCAVSAFGAESPTVAKPQQSV